MEESPRCGFVGRAWVRLVDGEASWGTLIVQPQRFGATRYKLIVYPPGLGDAERRWIRAWRGWPVWGAVLWLVAMIWLSHHMTPLVALVIATGGYFGVGAAAFAMAGPARAQVRIVYAEVLAGRHDPIADARRRAVEVRAATLGCAYDRYRGGEVSAVDYEAIWWQVYMRPNFGLRDEMGIITDAD